MSHLLEGILHLPPALALALVFLLPALEASAFVGNGCNCRPTVDQGSPGGSGAGHR